MNTSPEINEIAMALSAAQYEFSKAKKGSLNPAFKSYYADLAAVIDAVREPLAKWKLAVVQEGKGDRDRQEVNVLTLITHGSGQWIETGPLTIPVTKMDAFGYGSAYTYAKRYALLAALNLANEDDDGVAAVGSTAPAPRTAASARTPAPASSPVPPEGFEAWMVSLTKIADEGEAALRVAWNPPKKRGETQIQHAKAAKKLADFRDYLTTSDPQRWENLKLSAATVQLEKAT
jgi:hypothetical protein